MVVRRSFSVLIGLLLTVVLSSKLPRPKAVALACPLEGNETFGESRRDYCSMQTTVKRRPKVSPLGGTEGGLPGRITPFPKGQTQRKLGRGDFRVQAKMPGGKSPQQPSLKPMRDHATVVRMMNQNEMAEPFRNHGQRPWLQEQ